MAVASSLLQISPQRVSAVPGAPLSFQVTAINDTRSIRYLDIALIGLEGAAVRTNPAQIQLPPEGVATIAVTVQIAFVTAGETSFGLELRDASTGELFAYGDVELVVEDISQARLEMPDAHISGLTKDTTEVTITNTGATALAFVMHASAPDGSLGFEFDPAQFTVPPDTAFATHLTVRRRAKAFGQPDSYVFDVYAHGSSRALSVPGQFRQVAVFPPLIFKIIAVVAASLLLIFILLRLGSRLINDLEPFEWVELANAPDDFERYGHTAVWVQFEPPDQPVGLSALWNNIVGFMLGQNDQEEAMIVWGGVDATGEAISSGAMYSVASETWSSITDASNPPTPRAGHGAVWTGERMVIWGGETNDGSQPPSYGAQFDPQRSEWTLLPTENAPSPRRGHSTTWTGSELIIFGGETFDGIPLSDGAILRPDRATDDLADGEWQPLPTFPGDPRSFHAAAWTGEYLIVFGGFTATGASPSLAVDAYAYEVDRWRWWDITLGPAAPSGRACHRAIYTGESTIFLGGVSIADVEQAIAANPQWEDNPGFEGLCGITVATSTVDPTTWSVVVTPSKDPVFSFQDAGARIQVIEIEARGPELLPRITSALSARAVDVELTSSATRSDGGAAFRFEIELAPPSTLDDVIDVLQATNGVFDAYPVPQTIFRPEYEWVELPDAPRRLANRFSVIWTGKEATVVLPIEELDTVGAVRYVPDEGFEPLPLPASDVIGFRTRFTSVWINGGMIVFGGRDFDGDPAADGALLVLPDR